MTRKDFEIIAEMVADLINNDKLDPENDKTREIIDSWLKRSNPGYKPERFWKYVGRELGIEIELD